MLTDNSKVSRIGDFPKGSYVKQFFGVSYDEAVKSANKSDLDCQRYYEQKHKGYKQVSILVAYTEKKKEKESDVKIHVHQ